MRSMYAYLDDFGKITIRMNRSFYQGRSDFFYLTGSDGSYKDLLIAGVEEHPDDVRYILTATADMNFGVDYRIHESHGLSVPLEIRLITSKPVFAKMFDYDGDDLGSTYHSFFTTFAVWAPTAVDVLLHLWDKEREIVYPMKRTDKGVWRCRVDGDLKHALYTYIVKRNGITIETLDPYAYSSTANGERSAVIDLEQITCIPDKYVLPKMDDSVDAIIYECSVRDMTSSEKSGTSTHGTFKALTEEGTSWKGSPTGIDYLKRLGVTHVQFLPVQDFVTVDENHPNRNYNWGYDPAQYMTPEGSYATDPNDPYCRMKELKEMVVAFHKNGMRVNLDVVFNHMYDVRSSAFDKIVPFYYFRYNDLGFLSNGSYCGNDLDSMLPMVRKYFVHVCTEYMKVYGVDGFRFDLMGVLDVDTMNEIRKACRAIKKEVMIYGEGWDLPTNLPNDLKAKIVNQNEMQGIGHFNDYFRDTVKGKTSDDSRYATGYITGDTSQAFAMCSAITGNVLKEPFFFRFDSPCKTINGVETHDNCTAWDKMRACCGNETHDTRVLRQKMLIASTLFSVGVPFLHAGEEYCGTKNNESNSYNAGDRINQMDWDRAILNKEVVEYTKKAIALRKLYSGFRLSKAEDVLKCVHPVVIDDGVVVCDFDVHDSALDCTHLRVIYNPTYTNHEYNYDGLSWKVVFDSFGNAQSFPSDKIYVPGLSVIVAIRND